LPHLRRSRYVPLRIAVNNAGIGATSQSTGEYDVNAWRRVMSVNLDGVFYCIRAEIGPISVQGELKPLH
jgi:NAD(P)-dependent dehydrogenase (short-subunit alcohol dehydrogenase family)